MAVRSMLTSGGSSGGYTGTLGAGNDVFGRRPIIPSLDDAMMQALMANLGNFGDLAALGRKTSDANQGQVLNQMMAADPLFKQNLALQSQTINDQLNARLPDAAQRYLSQVAAEGNLALGTQGSPFGANRQVSLAQENILPWMQQGVTNANAFRQNVSSTATAPIYDVSKGFVSAEDQAQRNLLQAYAAAAPDPAARGKYEEDLAREFFNRTQAAGAPRQPQGGGATAPRPGTTQAPNSQYGAVDYTRSVSTPPAPVLDFWKPKPQTGQFPVGAGGQVSGGFHDLSQQYSGYSLPSSSFDLGVFRSPTGNPGYASQGPPPTYGEGIPDLSMEYSGWSPSAPAAPAPFDFDFGQIDYSSPTTSMSGAPLASTEDIMAYFMGDY